MRRVLFTGGTGFVGKNIIPLLKESYIVDAPSRQELDLRDEKAVEAYVSKTKYDLVIHAANPNPVKNPNADQAADFITDSLRIFLNFYRVRDKVGKIFYLGSGAEYGKSADISLFPEAEIFSRIPLDGYGVSKLYMNELARKSENVYNLRLFGCYGPYDHESKFLTHVIRSILEGRRVTIRQNCLFDYLQVYDLAEIIRRMDRVELKYHDYNVCTGKVISLREIAESIMKKMGVDEKVELLSAGMNHEYTGDPSRMLAEIGEDFPFTSLEEGIDIQIQFEKQVLGE